MKNPKKSSPEHLTLQKQTVRDLTLKTGVRAGGTETTTSLSLAHHCGTFMRSCVSN